MRAWRFSAARPVVPGSAPSKASRRSSIASSRKRDAEALGDETRVAARALAVVARGHRDRLDLVGAERVGSERGHERGVDAAREPEQHALEAVLAHVVGEPEAQRAPQLRRLAGRRLGDRRRQRRAVAAELERERRRRMQAPAALAPQARVAQPLVCRFLPFLREGSLQKGSHSLIFSLLPSSFSIPPYLLQAGSLTP